MSVRPRLALPFLIALSALLTASAAPAGWRDKPGAFDYYVLVLGWARSYCRNEGRFRHDGECGASKPRAFILHGLWPQYAKGWPEDCPTGKRPWVPSHVIDEMRDLMPSKSLIIHEYRTHGTCSGLEPAQYFGLARELYERVSVPEHFLAPGAEFVLSAEEIEREFAAANPWLKPEMFLVSCRGADLLDVRVCFGRDLFPRSCGVDEDRTRLCRASKIEVPPVTQ
jgi:ribonuclease T2